MYEKYEYLINDFMPTLESLARRYTNEYFDFNEMLSAAQMYLIEYLSKPHDKIDIRGHLWNSINYKLEKLSKKQIPYEIISLHTTLVIYNDQESFSNIDIIEIAKKVLTNKEFNILTTYYGIYTNKKTLEQIGNKYNLSRERIRQILRESESKIRKYCDEHDIIGG